MRNYTIIIILTFVLLACDSKHAEQATNSGHSDTLIADSTLIKTNRIFDNPYRDINNFDEITGDSAVDGLYRQLSLDGQTTIEIKNDICAGDNCTSIKSLKNGNTALYLFKSDGGEYGFSNDQFILKRDSLSFARKFNVSVEIWPTDTTKTIWSCAESVYYFYKDHVKILERKVLTKDLYGFDFTLRGINYEIKSANGTNLYKEKNDELTRFLSAKNED